MISISIIVPYYKKKNYIIKCLNSIYNQSFKNFEIILIYDDINKKDFEFITKLFKKKKNFFIFANKTNLGAGASRNIGISKSRGKYIAFLDADDFWHKDKLKIQYKFMINSNILISHTNYAVLNQKGKVKKFFQAKLLDYNKLLHSCDIGLSSVMLNKKILKNLKFPRIKTKEDYTFWLLITKKNKCKIFPINKNLTYWNDAKNSLSSNNIQKLKDALVVYNKYCKFNIIKSLFYVIRLSYNAIKKKYDI